MNSKRIRIAFDISGEENEKIAAAASLAGIPTNTVARTLFRWAWPLFESQGFNLVELKKHYGSGEALLQRLDPNANRRPRPAKPKVS